jgi:hypothetical protein
MAAAEREHLPERRRSAHPGVLAREASMDESNTGSAARVADFDLKRQQTLTMLPIAAAFPIAIAIWFATYALVPPLAGMDEVGARLVFALKCTSIAILFCFVTGIEAVAHERLRSPAIDPLSGY